MAVERESWRARLLQDVFRVLVFAVVVGGVAAAVYFPPRTSPQWLDVIARVFAGFTAELLAIALFRLVLPTPRRGAHRIAKDGQYAAWLLSAAFAEVAMHPALRFPFWFLHSTRVLYLRALGARVSWGASLHEQVNIREPALFAVGTGSQIEPGVTVEAALHGAGRVRVGPVTIGEGCLIGAHAILLPGSTIGHDARIESGAIVGEDARVGVQAVVGAGARLGQEVDLGSYTSVGAGAIVAQGVVVGDRGRIAPGAVVERDTKIGEREVWGGTPAVRLKG
ncbi:MAG: DapH/DapD/GlmU-related protein [Deltaproteobacteria bacterium]|jgi:acetyltransferase-like isoleucine patch superfamily enzyme